MDEKPKGLGWADREMPAVSVKGRDGSLMQGLKKVPDSGTQTSRALQSYPAVWREHSAR